MPLTQLAHKMPCWYCIACTLQHNVAEEKLAAYAQTEAAICVGLCRRIGSDEEQQLLRTAKDDLNISSSSRGMCHLCPCLLTNADLSGALSFDTPLWWQLQTKPLVLLLCRC